MSLVSTDDVEARIATGLTTDALQTLIDAQEAYLARKIGPLIGEREATYYPKAGDGPIMLARTGAIASVTMAGSTLDPSAYRLDGTELSRTPLAAPWGWYGSGYVQPWSVPVVVTYTPNDEDDVREAIIEMVRVALAGSPYNSESAEGHSFSMDESIRRQRAQIVRTLMPNRGPHSIPLR